MLRGNRCKYECLPSGFRFPKFCSNDVPLKKLIPAVCLKTKPEVGLSDTQFGIMVHAPLIRFILCIILRMFAIFALKHICCCSCRESEVSHNMTDHLSATLLLYKLLVSLSNWEPPSGKQRRNSSLSQATAISDFFSKRFI